MTKLISTVIVAISAVCASADGTNTLPSKAKSNHQRAGLVEKPGSQKGRVLFVNAQNTIAEKPFRFVADKWSEFLRIKVDVEQGVAVDLKSAATSAKSIKANSVLFIVDNEKIPTSLVFMPEERCCILNVHPIFDDKPDAKLIELRACQETTRAFSLLAGAMTSTYPDSLMSPVKNPAGLDFNEEPWRVPADVIQRFPPYLTALGITPKLVVPYRKAVEQGWAPQPTNDIQKTIWEKVHEPPSKPLKITYDKDKQKPVVK